MKCNKYMPLSTTHVFLELKIILRSVIYWINICMILVLWSKTGVHWTPVKCLLTPYQWNKEVALCLWLDPNRKVFFLLGISPCVRSLLWHARWTNGLWTLTAISAALWKASRRPKQQGLGFARGQSSRYGAYNLAFTEWCHWQTSEDRLKICSVLMLGAVLQAKDRLNLSCMSLEIQIDILLWGVLGGRLGAQACKYSLLCSYSYIHFCRIRHFIIVIYYEE